MISDIVYSVVVSCPSVGPCPRSFALVPSSGLSSLANPRNTRDVVVAAFSLFVLSLLLQFPIKSTVQTKFSAFFVRGR